MNAARSGCPINLTLEALGDRWSLIVIRDLEKPELVSRRDDPSRARHVQRRARPLAGSNSRECLPDDAAGLTSQSPTRDTPSPLIAFNSAPKETR